MHVSYELFKNGFLGEWSDCTNFPAVCRQPVFVLYPSSKIWPQPQHTTIIHDACFCIFCDFSVHFANLAISLTHKQHLTQHPEAASVQEPEMPVLEVYPGVVPVGESTGEWRRNETTHVLRISIIYKFTASQDRTRLTSLVRSKHLCARVQGIVYSSMFEHWILQLFRQVAELGLKSSNWPFTKITKIPNKLDFYQDSQAPSLHLKWEPLPRLGTSPIWFRTNLRYSR